MEGMFKVNRPLSLFNYVVLKDNILIMEESKMASQAPRSHEELQTYVSLSISLDPILEVPQENELEYYPGFESQALLITATDWAKLTKTGKASKRYIKLFGENIDGHSILLCRYLADQ